MPKYKDQNMWGITYTNCGDVMPDTIRRTRHEARGTEGMLRQPLSVPRQARRLDRRMGALEESRLQRCESDCAT